MSEHILCKDCSNFSIGYYPLPRGCYAKVQTEPNKHTGMPQRVTPEGLEEVKGIKRCEILNANNDCKYFSEKPDVVKPQSFWKRFFRGWLDAI